MKFDPPSLEQQEALRRRAQELWAQSARTWNTWQQWWRMWQHLRALPPDHRLVPVCSSCGRFRDETGAWHELPPKMSDRFHVDGPLQVTHGICTDCFAKALDDLRP
jgi:hypothetical protein